MLCAAKKWMDHCLAIVLTTVMFLSFLPETASAVSSIGLSYSQPSAGSGKLHLYWDSVPNVEFYAYSVRDITTGESIKSNERTSGTSVSVRWTWENNHSYRVWAGACCTGNDPDNTSTWDYTGMDTFTIVGCPHRNTDVGWDINKPMTYKSISGSEHKVTGYLYEYCTECFEQIGASYKVTETEPHIFDAAGDCIVCDYRHSCQHKETKLVIMDGYPAYKQINDKEHKCTTAYNRVCANASCGKVVKMNDSQSSETQPHRFDSNGRCKDCGYMKTYEALRLGVSRSKAEAYVGDSIGASASASGGDGQYRYEWEVSLNGQVIDRFAGGRDDAYSRTASSVGQYVFTVTVTDGQGNSKTASSQSITVKEKTCNHISYTDVPGTVKYSQISDSMHKKTTLIRRVCDNCKTTLNEYKKDESEAHHFANGTCTECGAADPSAVCKHKHTTDQLAYSSITGQGNTQQHIVTDSYNVVCNDCGITVRHYESRRMQNHSLNANGVCKCGYSQPKGCDHANKREIFLRVISYVDKGTVGHEKTSVYSIECADCGIVLTAEKNITVVENHSYANNNQCVCGAQGHLHDFEQILISGPSYVKLDGDTHTVTTVYQKKCKTCGYLLDKETETRQEKHRIIRTSYETEHPHKRFKVCGDCHAHPYILEDYFTANGKVQSQEVCCICHGHDWQEPKNVNGEWRKYCKNCGLSQKVEAPIEEKFETADAPDELTSVYDEISKLSSGDSFYYNLRNAMLDEQGKTLTIGDIEIPINFEVFVESAYNVIDPEDWNEMEENVREKILWEYVMNEQNDIGYYYGLLLSDNAELFENIFGVATEKVSEAVIGEGVATNISTSLDLLLATKELINSFISIDNATEAEKYLFAYMASDVVNQWNIIDQLEQHLGEEYSELCQQMKRKLLEAANNNFDSIMQENKEKREQTWKKFGLDIGTTAGKFVLDQVALDAAAHVEAATYMLAKYGTGGMSTAALSAYKSIAGFGEGSGLASSILLGVKIGNLVTPEVGALIDGKHELIILNSIESRFKSQMNHALNSSNESEDLYIYTKLFLATRSVGLDSAEAYDRKVLPLLQEERNKIKELNRQIDSNLVP